MDLQSLIKSYNLKDITIIKSLNKNNSYLFYLSFEVDFPMIANGCRPEFDYDIIHLFEFPNQDNININCDEVQYILDYNLDNNILILKTNKQIIKINNCDIKIKSNVLLQEFYI